MSKIILVLCFFSLTLPLFAQRETEDMLRKNNMTIRVLEEKIRNLEQNHRTQLEYLQNQILLLSAKDTSNQKQLLQTLTLYLEQSDKKYAEELAALKKQREERKNEIGGIVQAQTSSLQQQINHQTDMLFYGSLGIIALSIILFFVALKFLKDQQERYLSNFARKQQNEINLLIEGFLKEVLSKEKAKISQATEEQSLNNELKEQFEELASLLKNAIEDFETQTALLSQQNPNKPTPQQLGVSVELPQQPIQPQIWEEIIEETPIEVQEITTEAKENINQQAEDESPNTPQETTPSEEEKTIFEAKENTTETNIETEEYNVVYDVQYEKKLQEGITLYEQKNYQEAITKYSEAITFKPDDYLLYTRRANCYHVLRKYDQATEDYEKAIRLKNDFIPAYNNAIEIYILTDNFFQALTLLERLCKIDKNHNYKAVELYLKLIAQKGLMQNTEKTEKELDSLMRENFTFNFSVKEIDDWLITAEMDSNDKKMIRVKTELLKMKKEANLFI
ncbi:MAG: hypothetical protein SFU27_07415 [Thermonemataceae bacterium]|nr:hypothetical protein [Thermonemataceae bacterium]